MDESSLPTDIHLVEYEVGETLYAEGYGLIRRLTSSIPTMTAERHWGTLLAITNGFGHQA